MLRDIWDEYIEILRKKEELEDGLYDAVLETFNFVVETNTHVRNIKEGTSYLAPRFRQIDSWEVAGNSIRLMDIEFPAWLVYAAEGSRAVWQEEQVRKARVGKISREQWESAQRLQAERDEYARLKAKFEGT